MSYDSEEWNRWRGRQEALLENLDKSLENIDDRLADLEKEHWMLYAKVIGLSASVSLLLAFGIQFLKGG